MKCDFCDQPNPAYYYPCPAFQLISETTTQAAVYDSGPDWACCETCSNFVETRDWNGLWKHMIRVWPIDAYRSTPQPNEPISSILRFAWEKFANMRQGRQCL